MTPFWCQLHRSHVTENTHIRKVHKDCEIVFWRQTRWICCKKINISETFSKTSAACTRCFDRPIYLWHTQQMITPPTTSALSAVCTEHTNRLAAPKDFSHCRQLSDFHCYILNCVSYSERFPLFVDQYALPYRVGQKVRPLVMLYGLQQYKCWSDP